MNQINTDQNNIKTFPKLFTVKKFAQKNREQGSWPGSESAIWALRASSPENGFAKVFVTIGRRVLIDEEKFWEVVKNSLKDDHE